MDDLKSKNNFVIIPGNENYKISENITVNGLNFFLTKTLPDLV